MSGPQPVEPDELERELGQFVEQRPVLIASDFDGVLAPIVQDPESARALPGVIDSLRQLSHTDGVSVAIASGRALETLRRLTGIRDDEPVTLIGSHGAESSIPLGLSDLSRGLDADESARLKQAHLALEEVRERHPLVRIENKPAGVVLHTRGTPDADADAAAELARSLAAGLPGVHAMSGKSVVELSVLDVSKGAALTALAQHLDARNVAYFGDDVTDETAFVALKTVPREVLEPLTIKVGDGESAARLRVESPQDVAMILSRLAELTDPASAQ